MSVPACRFCGGPLELTFVDLGLSPLCESYVPPDRLEEPEPLYPLHARVCERCFLVQLPQVVSPEEIFGEYAYFSSYSTSWVEHARRYAEAITARLGLGAESLVVELGSNDGYLLQHFLVTGIPVLGIEPAANVARAAEERGVPTLVDFFDRELAGRLAAEGRRASLIVANNVVAQVPGLNDLASGIAALLAPGGTVTLELPHLLRLIEGVQYDTVYHEHFSYFSLETLAEILRAHSLAVVDLEELPTHGGSLRVFAVHADEARRPSAAVEAVLERERAAGLRDPATYAAFTSRVEESSRAFVELLQDLREDRKQVVAYGAPGKGSTLLNYCGVGTELIAYTVDRNPHKQGMFLPGTRLPIHHPDRIAETRPDYVVVLPWNLLEEIREQLRFLREWGGRLIVPIPTARIVAV